MKFAVIAIASIAAIDEIHFTTVIFLFFLGAFASKINLSSIIVIASCSFSAFIKLPLSFRKASKVFDESEEVTF